MLLRLGGESDLLTERQASTPLNPPSKAILILNRNAMLK